MYSRSVGGEVRVRRLRGEEGALLKELRLEALGSSPEAFAETLAEAKSRDAEWGSKLTQSVTVPGPHAAFVAERGHASTEGSHHGLRGLGMVFGIVDASDPRVGRVGGLWVAPQARRSGVGRRLLSAVFGWARGEGRGEVALWAPVEAEAARALYAAAGFSATGATREVGLGMRILELRRPLA